MADPPPWQSAASFAARMHGQHMRHDGRTPYIAHPARVALTVALVFGCTDEAVITAALLHDVIEDSPADYDDLLERFGPFVADLVACLSKDMRVIEPERERAYDTQLAEGPWQARLIKLADVYDNLTEAATDSSKRRMLARARRALDLARRDEPLGAACAAVEALVQHVEGALDDPQSGASR